MIDWSQIKQLEDDIGAEDFGEVIVIFLEEVEETIDKLRSGDAFPVDEIESTMHFLKGSALNLGFQDFADLCSDGESKAKNGAGTEVALSQVVSLYDASKVEFLANAATHTSYQP
jgi:HPt (histidine-containing phosphotransfer) domain-containing protein